MTDGRKFRTFAEFWPHYVSEHADPRTRKAHVAGTGLAALCLAALAATGDLRFLAAAAVVGYGLAWLSHLFIERNRPATFRHPVLSLLGDLRMFALACRGRLSAEVARLQADGR